MGDEKQPPLSYERPPASPVPRWQFRLMLLLVLANLAITVQMAYAPGVTAAVGKWWEEYKATRQQQALQRQAWGFTEPAGTVVWEEDAEAAARLRAKGNYRMTQVPRDVQFGNYPFLNNWPRGAAAAPPAFAGQLQRNFPVFDSGGHIPQQEDDWAVLLLHGLKSPGGRERLVYVVALGNVELDSNRVPGDRTSPPCVTFEAGIKRRLRLIATACAPVTGTERLRPQPGDTTELIVTPGGNAPWMQPWRRVPAEGGKPGEVRLEAGPRFRFYAGQPDPADASHFTIDYDLNDVRGKIHGRLKDDGTVELKPEAGTVSPPDWDPLVR